MQFFDAVVHVMTVARLDFEPAEGHLIQAIAQKDVRLQYPLHGHTAVAMALRMMPVESRSPVRTEDVLREWPAPITPNCPKLEPTLNDTLKLAGEVMAKLCELYAGQEGELERHYLATMGRCAVEALVTAETIRPSVKRGEGAE